MSAIIVTGDDVTLPVTLKKDSATFTIPVSATVKTAIVSPNRDQVLIPASLSSDTASGADWANSLIIATFSSTETSKVTNYGDAILEIQVNDSGKTTWFTSLIIEKGSIT